MNKTVLAMDFTPFVHTFKKTLASHDYWLKFYSYKMIIHSFLVFESPVWSGLLTLRDLDRNRNWSIKVLEPQKTGPDRL